MCLCVCVCVGGGGGGGGGSNNTLKSFPMYRSKETMESKLLVFGVLGILPPLYCRYYNMTALKELSFGGSTSRVLRGG